MRRIFSGPTNVDAIYYATKMEQEQESNINIFLKNFFSFFNQKIVQVVRRIVSGTKYSYVAQKCSGIIIIPEERLSH